MTYNYCTLVSCAHLIFFNAFGIALCVALCIIRHIRRFTERTDRVVHHVVLLHATPDVRPSHPGAVCYRLGDCVIQIALL